ncbi:MAG TPA: hypothetical protein DDZ76_05620 [Xanthomonadales bacterium]|nr:hypothetical protein [Xanthomonadales bacterium]
MTTERTVNRVDDKDIVEPYIWQIDKVYETEGARIDSYLRERAKTLVVNSSKLSDGDLSTTAKDEQERLKSRFCLLDDQGLDIETYEKARNGEIRRQTPKRLMITIFHVGAAILALCEISLFVVQAMLLDEYQYVPIIFGLMIVIFSWYAGQQAGDAMFKWHSFRGHASGGLGTISDSSQRSIRLNVILLIVMMCLVFGIALMRSYDTQTFSPSVFIFTYSIALGIIGMEAWAVYEKGRYESAVSLMIKAQRYFASKNHHSMYRSGQWQKNFIAHYRELSVLMQDHDKNPHLHDGSSA